MKNLVSRSVGETSQIASKWLDSISMQDSDSADALVVGLSGHLGAGKTAFVKLVAKDLGVKEDVTSPTFVIMKIYATTHPKWRRLVHIDAYRLERREELAALRLEDLIGDPHNLIIVEWPENVGLGKENLDVMMKFEIKDGLYMISV
jgi:tRNA threonylcarbamoyladenosine biosynthesis protein TsaE